MAGVLPGESSVITASDSWPSRNSLENQEVEVGLWYFSRKEIEENSPSRRDGIDLKKETYLRKSYCTYLQALGMRLKVPQVTIATAIIFCHRFFIRQSHAKNDRRTIATVCMFLAAKVEETPRLLKDVIIVSYEIIHKKDPAAAHRIKQKEVYEQQKELTLVGEKVLLATLGFDLNVHHPYKPLVGAIKKFKVAQNALAQVAWNFVNDGLRTSLCLQFKPHHIAAGAIFLAAKFLRVKLPSEGDKVWWQEFDVTPRQLEEVSNQMLELYEQNRVPPSQGSEMEGSTGVSGASYCGAAKTTVTDERDSRKISTNSAPENPYADHEAPIREMKNHSNDNGSGEMGSFITDHKVDGEKKNNQHHEEVVPHNENTAEISRNSTPELKRFKGEDRKQSNGTTETAEVGECKGDSTPLKPANVVGRKWDLTDGPIGQSPKETIKIDRDKVKAKFEKTKKARLQKAMKRDAMDEDDLIEREIEEGLEFAVEEQEKIPKSENDYESKKHEEMLEVNNLNMKGHTAFEGLRVQKAEEGETSSPYPMFNNRKRKTPPGRHLEEKKRLSPGSTYYNHDTADDRCLSSNFVENPQPI